MEENVAAEKLGVEHWDRPAIFREAADAATETGLPYWLVLLLSGAIATLGLALNSAAVVIGAMLIAPLLSPIVGLAMALAVGDGRLAVQMLVVVLLSTLGVVAGAALLTALLPYHTVTAEILARTRPTTLDLAIAVFSGLAGAVVTVARRTRLSAAVPGVAISVALVPPLGVAGFGIGVGWDWALIKGSLLLYSANFGGIVLSGMVLFMFVGMQRPEVLRAARDWHRDAQYTGLYAWLDLKPAIRSIGIFNAPFARLGLAAGFVLLVAFPLRVSLQQIVREARIERAVATAEHLFNDPGRSSILSRQLVLDPTAKVFLRVATVQWYGDDARREFERIATDAAGETVDVVLEQLPAAGDDLERLSEMLNGAARRTVGAAGALDGREIARQPDVTDMLRFLRSRVASALASLTLPDSAYVLDATLAMGTSDSLRVIIDYLAPRPFSRDAAFIVARQFSASFPDQPVRAALRYVGDVERGFTLAGPSDAQLQAVADVLRRAPALHVTLRAGPDVQRALADTTLQRLARLAAAPGRVRVETSEQTGFAARFFAPTPPP